MADASAIRDTRRRIPAGKHQRRAVCRRRQASIPSADPLPAATRSSRRDVSSHLARIADAQWIDFALEAYQIGIGALVAGAVLQRPDVRIGDENAALPMHIHDLI